MYRGSRESEKPGKVTELCLRSGKVWKTGKSEGIKFGVRENLEYLEKSGSFSDEGILGILIVFFSSLSMRIPIHFILVCPKIAGKREKCKGMFKDFVLKAWKSQGLSRKQS